MVTSQCIFDFFMPDSTEHVWSVLQFGEKVQINIQECHTQCLFCLWKKSSNLDTIMISVKCLRKMHRSFSLTKSMPAAFFSLCHRTCCRWGFITPACFLCQRLRTTDDIWSCCPEAVGRTDITPIKTWYLGSLERASVLLSKAAWSHDPQNNLSASSEPEQSHGGYPKRYLGSSTPHKWYWAKDLGREAKFPPEKTTQRDDVPSET